MLTFYYTRNAIRCWIMIYYSKQFNYAYSIYALRTGFFFFKLLNLFHFLELKVHWGLKLYEQVVKVFLMFIMWCYYKVVPLQNRPNPCKTPGDFFKISFLWLLLFRWAIWPKVFFFYQKSLKKHQLIHELLKVGTFKSQNIVKSFKRSFSSKMSGRNMPHEPNRQSGG